MIIFLNIFSEKYVKFLIMYSYSKVKFHVMCDVKNINTILDYYSDKLQTKMKKRITIKVRYICSNSKALK